MISKLAVLPYREITLKSVIFPRIIPEVAVIARYARLENESAMNPYHLRKDPLTCVY